MKTKGADGQHENNVDAQATAALSESLLANGIYPGNLIICTLE